MIARAYGGLTINGVHYKYDYARDELISEGELKLMAKAERQKRMAESEKAKRAQVALTIENPRVSA